MHFPWHRSVPGAVRNHISVSSKPTAAGWGVGLFLFPEGRNRSIVPVSHPGNAMGKSNSSLPS